MNEGSDVPIPRLMGEVLVIAMPLQAGVVYGSLQKGLNVPGVGGLLEIFVKCVWDIVDGHCGGMKITKGGKIIMGDEVVRTE